MLQSPHHGSAYSRETESESESISLREFIVHRTSISIDLLFKLKNKPTRWLQIGFNYRNRNFKPRRQHKSARTLRDNCHVTSMAYKWFPWGVHSRPASGPQRAITCSSHFLQRSILRAWPGSTSDWYGEVTARQTWPAHWPGLELMRWSFINDWEEWEIAFRVCFQHFLNQQAVWPSPSEVHGQSTTICSLMSLEWKHYSRRYNIFALEL